MVFDKNPCAWLLWHWSSRGQLALCNPRRQWVLSPTDRVQINVKKTIQNDWSFFKCALSDPRDWTLHHWSRAWPTLTWFTEFVVVAVCSSGCGRVFQRSKYKFSAHFKTLELMGKCGINPYTGKTASISWIGPWFLKWPIIYNPYLSYSADVYPHLSFYLGMLSLIV